MTPEQQEQAVLEYTERFEAMSDQELIDALNEDRPKQGWVSRRAVFLTCLRKELMDRDLDPDKV